jgi:hypothetical protein
MRPEVALSELTADHDAMVTAPREVANLLLEVAELKDRIR